MDTQSVWRATAPTPAYGALQGDAQCDVLIVGGGITGLTLALLVAQQGRSCVVLEAATIGSGTTGHSTGNLYVTPSQGLHQVLAAWDLDVTREVVAERQAAIDFIASEADAGGDFGFRRCPLVRYAQESASQPDIDKEFDALAQAGCTTERRKEVPAGLPAPAGDVLVLPGQAQFHPQTYVRHLAARAVQAGARILEQSCVIELDATGRLARTAGGTVRAQELVMATHTPKGVRMVHAEMPVHREYGIALGMPFPDPGPGIFWAKGEASLSIRTLETGDARFLVCAGSEHKLGLHNAKAQLMVLEDSARKHFGAAPVAFRWSAQNYRGADHLPYIGRDATGCFIATGFATDGLTWGTVAARLIAGELAGRKAALAQVCKPLRLSPVKGGKNILDEVRTMAKALVQDYLTDRQEEKLASLAPGDSAVVESDGQSVAAWRSPSGELFAVSPVCTHLGCKVHWNSVEASWDCPCHGSRFRPDGTVLEGPALAPLTRRHAQLR